MYQSALQEHPVEWQIIRYFPSTVDPGDEHLNNKRVVGRGTFSDVYQVGSGTSKKAMKSLRGLAPFSFYAREIKILSETKHPLVVEFLGYSIQGSEDQCHVNLFFEYMDHGSLATIFPDNHSGIDGDLLRAIMLQVNQGLTFLHESSIFHRDIKPENVLLSGTVVCKLADFGLSKFVDGSNSQSHSRSLIGTLVYLSPEAIMTHKFSKSSDIWAMGCLFQWLLTGKHPFSRPTVAVANTLFTMIEHIDKLVLGTFVGPPWPPSSPSPAEEAQSYRDDCFVYDPKVRPTAKKLEQHRYFDGLDLNAGRKALAKITRILR